MAKLNLKPKKIDLFADDRAFDLMTTATKKLDIRRLEGVNEYK